MQKIKKLLVPDLSELILFLSISAAMMVALSYKNIWLLLGGTDLDQLKYSDMINPGLQNLIYKIDNYFIPRFADFIIWILVGLIVFLGFSLVKTLIESASDERSLEEYINAPKHDSFMAYLSRVLIRITFSVLLVIWLFYFLFRIFPDLTKLFFTSITNLNDIISILWLGVSVILCAIGLYVFAIILRFIALKPRVFG